MSVAQVSRTADKVNTASELGKRQKSKEVF